MCGLSGFIDHNKLSDDTLNAQMSSVLSARGPDSHGSYFFDSAFAQIGLAHRRLSILDLSPMGHQPMHFEHLHITYNGEVYNFSHVREELMELGYKFSSDSDTEVILKAFHAWGKECVEKFRGMFAFVIFDELAQKLYMFRDRAGVKPFYYYAKDGLFLFASELKAFHEHPRFSKSINTDVIPTYMRFGYIPAPYSIFENTYKLKPGHYLEYDLATADFSIHCYWNVLDFYRTDKLNLTEDEILDDLESLLKESFDLRMISDVPVGVFLSGGIDSSIVTAMLQKTSDKPLKTFTIGFDEEGYNEAEFAHEISRYLGTDHTELYCKKSDALNVISDLPRIYDEPFGDSSSIATILVSELAKEKVSVVLSGDGGDEIFCGYSKYFALRNMQGLLKPGVKKSLLKFVVNVLNEKWVFRLNQLLPTSLKQNNIRDKYQKFKRAIEAKNPSEMFYQASSYVQTSDIERFLKTPTTKLSQTNFDHWNELAEADFTEHMMATDYQTFMVDDVLTKVDRATMSVSLEGREPLLDHKIIEYMARVPTVMKIPNGKGKYLLKKLLYRYVPESFYSRPKSGFQVPLYEWLKEDLRYLLDEYLSVDRLSAGGVFDENAVQQYLQDYYSGRYININIIWFILMFEMWREEWDV